MINFNGGFISKLVLLCVEITVTQSLVIILLMEIYQAVTHARDLDARALRLRRTLTLLGILHGAFGLLNHVETSKTVSN